MFDLHLHGDLRWKDLVGVNVSKSPDEATHCQLRLSLLRLVPSGLAERLEICGAVSVTMVRVSTAFYSSRRNWEISLNVWKAFTIEVSLKKKLFLAGQPCLIQSPCVIKGQQSAFMKPCHEIKFVYFFKVQETIHLFRQTYSALFFATISISFFCFYRTVWNLILVFSLSG